MKLCLIGEPNSPHIHRWLEDLYHEGHTIHFIAVNPVARHLPGVEYHDLQPSLNIPHLRLLIELPNLRRVLHEIKPDILHAHYIGHYGWLAALSGFHPMLLTAWGSDIYQEKRALARWLTCQSLRRADLITGDSRDLCNALVEAGATADRVSLVQFGVDLDLFHPGAETGDLRDKLELGDAQVVFCPRRSGPIYHTDTIIRAMPEVLRQIPTARFILRDQLGDESQNDYVLSLKQLAMDLGVNYAVRFVGQLSRDELALCYNLSRALVSVPDTDGSPVSVLEGMACGAVPVVSDVPSLREWIQNGENGMIVPTGNPDKLAQALIRLLNDEPTRYTMAQRNLELVRAKADRKLCTRQMSSHYERLAKQHMGKE
jgi:glycosyltransferase involved in cell wall biosynthesis